MVIGTTGRKPKTSRPLAARVINSTPPSANTTTARPGAGAGTTVWITATPITAAAVQSVLASAPHFVLPDQNRAATSRGARAA